jgi:colanic acid biosynthesis glycosyl transferase WcaI
MKILVHDYGGYPFPIQLSKTLAKRHHQVLHLYSGSFKSPNGTRYNFDVNTENFNCLPLYLSQPFAKYSLIKRRFQEVEYGKILSKEAEKFKPDVIISADTPLEAQKILLNRQKNNKTKFIFWLQDLHGLAISNYLSNRLSFVGKVIGSYYNRLELSLLNRSDHVVVITEDFLPMLKQANIPKEKIHVIHNWAPLEELPLKPKDNDWARKHGLHEKLCLLYTGTLGLKHNPELIIKLAIKFKNRNDVKIVILSEGLGAEFLRVKKDELKLDNLLLLGFQPFALLPEIYGAADILMAILQQEAGIFSVPSKILTYHCAGRALLLAVPANNLAARIVRQNQSGMVVDPDDEQGFLRAAEELLQDEAGRHKCGRNARNYAENVFDIEKITDKFETILNSYGGT